jgi:hypothetical protein
MARFNQTDFESGTKKETARKKIVRAAKRRGIKVGRSDNVTKAKKPGARKSASRTTKTASRKKTSSSRTKAKR